jgi:hypothetical protein
MHYFPLDLIGRNANTFCKNNALGFKLELSVVSIREPLRKGIKTCPASLVDARKELLQDVELIVPNGCNCCDLQSYRMYASSY